MDVPHVQARRVRFEVNASQWHNTRFFVETEHLHEHVLVLDNLLGGEFIRCELECGRRDFRVFFTGRHPDFRRFTHTQKPR